MTYYEICPREIGIHNALQCNIYTYYYDKNPKVRTKTKTGMLVNTTPVFKSMKTYFPILLLHFSFQIIFTNSFPKSLEDL